MRNTNIIEALEACRIDGFIHPKDVVEAARDPDNPMHSRFTWDDGKAAEQWRLVQARDLIRVVVTVMPNTDTYARINVSMRQDRTKGGPGYRNMASVMSDDDLRRQLLADARKDADAFRNRYNSLRELGKIIDAIDDFVPVAKPHDSDKISTSPELSL